MKGGEELKEFDALYRLHSKEIFKYLFYLTNDNSLAEELVQETFFQAFKSIHLFQGKSKVKTWLYQIAKHVHYKYIKKNPYTKSEEFSEKGEYAINYKTPEIILEKKEEEKLLLSLIMKLKEPYKQVVILRGLNELSFKEIGEILSQSENWARITFFRGKQKLQEILRGEEVKWM